MVAHVDGTVLGRRRSAPGIFVLPKRGRADDGRLVDALTLPTGVSVTITTHRTEGCSARHRAFFSDVIFDERTGRPPIDADKIIAAGKGADVIADRSGGAGVPAFAADDVSHIGVADREVAGELVGVGEGDVP